MELRAEQRMADRAMRSLDLADQRRAAAVQEQLRGLWLDQGFLPALVPVLNSLLPESLVSIYSRAPDGGLGELAFNWRGKLSTSWDDCPNHQQLPRVTRYSLHDRDPLANRPVSTRKLFKEIPESAALFRELLLKPVGAWYQLRAVVYDGPRFLAHVGFVRERSSGEFGRRETALLTAILPPIIDGLAVRRSLAECQLPFAAFDRALDLFDEPAYLVSERGAVVFANRAARAAGQAVPPWLGRWARDPFNESAGRVARGRRLELGGKLLWLVLPRVLPTDHGSPLESLPPSLRRVAEPLLQGLSDKEVAASTGLSLASVRTYVTRLYRRLNVHSRAELVARLLGR